MVECHVLDCVRVTSERAFQCARVGVPRFDRRVLAARHRDIEARMNGNTLQAGNAIAADTRYAGQLIKPSSAVAARWIKPSSAVDDVSMLEPSLPDREQLTVIGRR